MQTARNEGPVAPPPPAVNTPPAAPTVPDTVPTRRTTLSDSYQQRLSESGAATSKNREMDRPPPARAEAMPATARPTAPVIIGDDTPPQAGPALASADVPPATIVIGGSGDDAAPQLVPPRGLHGTRGMVAPPSSAASFEVARFQGEIDPARLRDLVALQRRSGGTIQLESGGDPALARRLAASLGQMGVPPRKLRLVSGEGNTPGVRVLMEY